MRPTPGKSLFSQVDTTSVVVIRWGDDDLDLTCGGTEMSETPSAAAATTDAGIATQLGKRYCTPDGAVELLCTKPGPGVLAIAGVALEIKTATPLPASD
ncbi:hypothetical protein [Gordonia sp. NPDC127522]|uniref:hypothetical protein n=1 Tax=Gordonia sp. NPDC127522 TaxID=3345390 RepID=UPI0036270ABF